MKGILTRLLIVLTICWIGGWLYGVFVAIQDQDGELLWLSIAMATIPPAAIWWDSCAEDLRRWWVEVASSRSLERRFQMTIAELGSIGELVGSIAVLVTLIYLATQIRQNTRSMEDNKKFAMAQAYQARTDMWIQVTGLADPDVLSRVSSRNSDRNSFGVFDPEKIRELTPAEAQRLSSYADVAMIAGDNMMYQRELGLIPDVDPNGSFVKWMNPLWRELGSRTTPLIRREMEKHLPPDQIS
jgi:hypothetical protein